MTIREFEELTKKGVVYLDGAMGTNLLAAGMPQRVCAEAWTLENPQVVLDLQRAYVEAGSQIIYAPTFGANRNMLKKHKLDEKIQQMNEALVALSREAAQGKALVAGDISPSGMILEDLGGEDTEEEVFAVYEEQSRLLAEAGVDLLVIETMMSPMEAVLALQAAKKVCDLPVMTTLTADPNGRCLFGGTVADGAAELQEEGASAVGINCCSGPDQVLSIIKSVKPNVSVPVIAKPNAGVPQVGPGGKAVYSMTPEEFAEHMEKLYEAGATMLGGCCGTNPEFIAALKHRIGG